MTLLDPDLLPSFYAGDHTLFRRLVDAHTPRLIAFVRPFADGEDDAEDLVQETWQLVYRKRETFRGTGTLLGWIYSIARNVCLGRRRRVAARSAVSPDPDLHMGEGAMPVERVVEAAEFRRDLNEAIMQLPDRERDVVILRLLEQRSTLETASALGCAEGTVKAALHHAVGKLRTSIKEWAP
ncbi:MAG: RNA polymerase sigma factor [Gemmatimonadetes bacterium]|nr:RNA polymerase sigma factor [Gemmatimonadota bacterium]